MAPSDAYGAAAIFKLEGALVRRDNLPCYHLIITSRITYNLKSALKCDLGKWIKKWHSQFFFPLSQS